MKPEYVEMIRIINKVVADFNLYLSSNHQVPKLNTDYVYDDNHFTRLSGKTWNDLRFPQSDKRGVYFIVGYDPDNVSRFSMYIGKASFKSSLGVRMASHLRKFRDQESYQMFDLKGNNHILEFVFAIDMETCGLGFLSSALEEFLIKNVKDELNLLNGTGNF